MEQLRLDGNKEVENKQRPPHISAERATFVAEDFVHQFRHKWKMKGNVEGPVDKEGAWSFRVNRNGPGSWEILVGKVSGLVSDLYTLNVMGNRIARFSP